MRRLQAFKYELIPTGDQQRQMRRFAGACRFVYNQALAFEQGEKRLVYFGLSKEHADLVGPAIFSPAECSSCGTKGRTQVRLRLGGKP